MAQSVSIWVIVETIQQIAAQQLCRSNLISSSMMWIYVIGGASGEGGVLWEWWEDGQEKERESDDNACLSLLLSDYSVLGGINSDAILEYERM